MTISANGKLFCELSDGSQVEVLRVMRGYVHPIWLTARLQTRDGCWRDLLVSRHSVSEHNHHKLRCALIGFRPSDD